MTQVGKTILQNNGKVTLDENGKYLLSNSDANNGDCDCCACLPTSPCPGYAFNTLMMTIYSGFFKLEDGLRGSPITSPFTPGVPIGFWQKDCFRYSANSSNGPYPLSSGNDVIFPPTTNQCGWGSGYETPRVPVSGLISFPLTIYSTTTATIIGTSGTPMSVGLVSNVVFGSGSDFGYFRSDGIYPSYSGCVWRILTDIYFYQQDFYASGNAPNYVRSFQYAKPRTQNPSGVLGVYEYLKNTGLGTSDPTVPYYQTSPLNGISGNYGYFIDWPQYMEIS